MVVDVNGISLHYEIVGEGEPLLWLHGGLGSGADWRYIFPEVPAGYRLLAPDLRGHGASTNPSGEFTFRQCAADLRAWLRHLGLPRVKAIVLSAPPYFPAEARAIQRQFSEAMVGEAEMERMRARHRHGEAQIQQLFAI